eukprot:1157779-Pelagomonas_calceolata.AAC.27
MHYQHLQPLHTRSKYERAQTHTHTTTRAQASARCCDMEQCREWLKWVTLLCCAPFGGNPAASSQPAPNNCASATAVASALLSSAQVRCAREVCHKKEYPVKEYPVPGLGAACG